MGCGNSHEVNKDVTEGTMENIRIEEWLSLNEFQYWYQVLDWLDFTELLTVSSTCHTIHDHSGYA